MPINPDFPIEAVNVGGKVLPARIVATDVTNCRGRQSWLGLVLEYGDELPFVMNQFRDYGWMVSSGRMLTVRNVSI